MPLARAGARDVAAWVVGRDVGLERFAATRNTVMLTQNNDGRISRPAVRRRAPARAGYDRVVVIKDWKRRYPHGEGRRGLGLHVAQDYSPLVAQDYHVLPALCGRPGEFFTAG